MKLVIGDSYKTHFTVVNAWVIALLSRTGSHIIEQIDIYVKRAWDENTIHALDWSQIGIALTTILRANSQVVVKILIGKPPTGVDEARAEAGRVALIEQVLGPHLEAHRLQVLWH